MAQDLTAIENQLHAVERELSRYRVESLALHQIIIEVAAHAGMDAGAVAQRLVDLEQQHWDNYLRHIEDRNPAAAARLDNREIGDIPTTDETAL